MFNVTISLTVSDGAGLIKTTLRIVHFVGLILGLGSATLLDLMLLRFLLTGRITDGLAAIVEFASKIISIGLVVLWVSGTGFLVHYAYLDPQKFENPKIWAKIAIVGILTMNGMVIHRVVLPLIRERVGQRLLEGLSFPTPSVLLSLGAISATSWYVPLLLGVIAQLNFVVGAWTILGIYFVIVAVTIAVGHLGLRVVKSAAAREASVAEYHAMRRRIADVIARLRETSRA